MGLILAKPTTDYQCIFFDRKGTHYFKDGKLIEYSSCEILRNQMPMINFLKKAKKTLDVCVMTLSMQRVVETILEMKDKGVRVRLIIDHATSPGVCIEKCVKRGVAICLVKSEMIMHHKFAIIDGKSLLSGSVNWSTRTKQGTHDNIVVTSNTVAVTEYQDMFNQIWTEYT